MYSICFSKLSLRQLKKLEKKIQKRIIFSLERCRVRPYSHVKKLTNSPYFRLRIGKYRAILKIIDNKLIVLVVGIKLRKNIYK